VWIGPACARYGLSWRRVRRVQQRIGPGGKSQGWGTERGVNEARLGVQPTFIPSAGTASGLQRVQWRAKLCVHRPPPGHNKRAHLCILFASAGTRAMTRTHSRTQQSSCTRMHAVAPCGHDTCDQSVGRGFGRNAIDVLPRREIGSHKVVKAFYGMLLLLNSDVTCGAVRRLTVDAGGRRPVAFYSHSISSTERN
jgi:hypothetical protein